MEAKTLIAVFSRTGITKALARAVSVKAEADLFIINPAKDYPASYIKCIAVAKIENIKNARPAIMGKPQNLEQYKNIILMFPIWWGQAPNIIHTFLDENNIAGKTILPICTHGGGGKRNTDKDLAQYSSSCTVLTCIDATKLKDAAVDTIVDKIKELEA